MAHEFWSHVKRLPLVDATKKQSTTVFAPRLGASSMAVVVERDFRLLLDRKDFSVLWDGCVKDAFLIGWSGSDVLLLHDLDKSDIVAWSASTTQVLWRAPAAAGSAAWDDLAISCSSPGHLQLRSLQDGTAVQSASASQGIRGPVVVGNTAICRIEQTALVGVRLPNCTEAWMSVLEAELEPFADRGSTTVYGSSDRRALVTWRGAMGLLDVGTGAWLWKGRRGRGGSAPLIAEGRVGFFGGGRLDVFEEDTGILVAQSEGVAPTIWDAPPVAYDRWMVVVDEQGFIVTVDLHDGRVIGVQQEKRVSFQGGAAVIDGQLVLGGTDGALWVYEPAGSRRVAVAGTTQQRRAKPKMRTE